MGTEPAFARQRRERGRLVVAALREPRQRLLAEHVDAAADPMPFELRRLAEAGDDVSVEIDDAEARAQRDHRDRRRRTARPLTNALGRPAAASPSRSALPPARMIASTKAALALPTSGRTGFACAAVWNDRSIRQGSLGLHYCSS